MKNDKYISNVGFIIFNNGLNAIRCDEISSLGPKENNNSNISEYYVNNQVIFKKSQYYREDISSLHQYITTQILNHLKFNITLDLNIDEVIKSYNIKCGCNKNE